MTKYKALLVAVMLYTVGDLLAERGIIKEKTALHRVGCLMVATAFGTLAVLGLYALLKIGGRA